MREQSELINFVLKKQNWNQSRLAEELSVSRGQITKWKNDTDSLPYDRERQLKDLAGFGDECVDWCLFAPESSEREAWISLIDEALSYLEEGCSSFARDFGDAQDLYASFVIFTLRDKMGVPIPAAPKDATAFLNDGDNAFASILIEFLENYDWLIYWSDHYLEGERFGDDLYDELMPVKLDGALSMAAYWVDNTFYEKAGISKEQIKSKKHAIKLEVIKSVTSLCEAMQLQKVDFEIDYFNFVNHPPCELDDDVLFNKGIVIPSSVEALLPFEQRKTIHLLEENNAILKEIRDLLIKK